MPLESLRKIILFLILLVWTAGCGSGRRDEKKAYLMKRTAQTTVPKKRIEKHSTAIEKKNPADTQFRIKEMEARHMEKLALIAAQKEKAIKKMESETRKSRYDSKVKIKKIEAENRIMVEKERQRYAVELAKMQKSLHQKYLLAFLAVTAVLLLFIYLLY